MKAAPQPITDNSSVVHNTYKNPVKVNPAAPVVNVAPANPAIIVSQDIPVFRTSTVIAAETDTTSINASLANIEGLLSNTIGRDIQVIAPVTPNHAPGSPLLIQHSQNQASMSGQATVQAQANAPEKSLKVDNHIDMKIESKPVNIMLDYEKVGAAAMRWVERQNLRNGVDAY